MEKMYDGKTMKILVKKLHPDAKIPRFAHEGDAGMDLYSVESLILAPMQRVSCRTGIAIQLPRGYVGLVWDKGSVSHKGGVKTLGGVMDSNYTGEYQIGLVNLGSEPYEIAIGQKIAQLLIQPVEEPEVSIVEELHETSRGHRAFGSTGKF